MARSLQPVCTPDTCLGLRSVGQTVGGSDVRAGLWILARGSGSDLSLRGCDDVWEAEDTGTGHQWVGLFPHYCVMLQRDRGS